MQPSTGPDLNHFFQPPAFVEQYYVAQALTGPSFLGEEYKNDKSPEGPASSASEFELGKNKEITLTSKALRKNKIGSFTVEAIGLSPIPSAGVFLGFFATSQFEIEGGVLSGKWVQKGADKNQTDAQIESLVQGRVYVGNSFNLTLGGAYRIYQRNIFLDSSNNIAEKSYQKNYYSTGLNIAIGNRWHGAWWHAGCDWAGLYLPLVSLAKTYSSTGLTPTEDNVQLDSLKAAKPDVGVQFLRIHLGISI